MSETPTTPHDPPPYPSESLEFRGELARLLNRYGIDDWAEVPDYVLAEVLADLVAPVRRARIATARWMGQPLLSEVLAASLATRNEEPR